MDKKRRAVLKKLIYSAPTLLVLGSLGAKPQLGGSDIHCPPHGGGWKTAEHKGQVTQSG